MDTKEYAIQGIKKELQQALNTEQACREGLRKIQGLELESIYDITGDDLYANPFHIIAQLKDLGRDRALFHTLAAESYINTIGVKMPLYWIAKWEAKPVSLKDLPLYVGWQVKTKLYEKLLKGL